jgi:signal transduction histidine kinase
MNALLVARLLATARSGAIAIDADGRIVLLNEAARRLLDLPPGEQVGRQLSEALRAQPVLTRLLADAIAVGPHAAQLPAAKAEVALVVGGRERAVGFTVHPASDESGRAVGALVLLKELSQIETGVETTLARERLAGVGAMAAAIAHEMRNPLAGIRLSASMLRRRLDLGPGEAGLLDEIVAEVRKLEDTVNRCLTYLRPLALDRQEVQLNEAVRGALALCEGTLAATEGRVRVEVGLADGLPPVVGDAHRLREAIANLVTNAVEATGEAGGVVTVSTACPHGDRADVVPSAVYVSVADTGPGIEPDIMDKIFYPFFTTKAGGSGVGLATVQKIITGHGGCVEVSSEPGRGANFRIVLPVPPASARLAARARRSA